MCHLLMPEAAARTDLLLQLQRALRWDLNIHTSQQNAFICLLLPLSSAARCLPDSSSRARSLLLVKVSAPLPPESREHC